MNVTFYILLGFILGVTLICAMIIVVTFSNLDKKQEPEIIKHNNKRLKEVAYKERGKTYHTYDSSGRKRKVVNVRYQDSGRSV